MMMSTLTYASSPIIFFSPPLDTRLDHFFIFKHCTTQFYFTSGDCFLYQTRNGRSDFVEPCLKEKDLAVLLRDSGILCRLVRSESRLSRHNLSLTVNECCFVRFHAV